MDIGAPNLAHQETNLSALIVLLLLGSDLLGQLAAWGVRDKYWDMVATISEPIVSSVLSANYLTHADDFN